MIDKTVTSAAVDRDALRRLDCEGCLSGPNRCPRKSNAPLASEPIEDRLSLWFCEPRYSAIPSDDNRKRGIMRRFVDALRQTTDISTNSPIGDQAGS